MVQSVVTVMRQTPEVDVLTLGVSSLSSDTWHSTGVGWNHFCSQSELVLQKFPKLRYYMVLVREACLDQKPWLFVVLASCKQLLHRLDAEVSRQIIVKHQVAALNLGGFGDEYLSKWRGACHS